MMKCTSAPSSSAASVFFACTHAVEDDLERISGYKMVRHEDAVVLSKAAAQ